MCAVILTAHIPCINLSPPPVVHRYRRRVAVECCKLTEGFGLTRDNFSCASFIPVIFSAGEIAPRGDFVIYQISGTVSAG